MAVESVCWCGPHGPAVARALSPLGDVFLMFRAAWLRNLRPEPAPPESPKVQQVAEEAEDEEDVEALVPRAMLLQSREAYAAMDQASLVEVALHRDQKINALKHELKMLKQKVWSNKYSSLVS